MNRIAEFQPAGEKHQAGQQLHDKIARRDGRATVFAAPAQHQPCHQRDVQPPRDGVFAMRTMRRRGDDAHAQRHAGGCRRSESCPPCSRTRRSTATRNGTAHPPNIPHQKSRCAWIQSKAQNPNPKAPIPIMNSKNRPHPDPLPQGEGTAKFALEISNRIHLADRLTTILPLPAGEGLGEGFAHFP